MVCTRKIDMSRKVIAKYRHSGRIFKGFKNWHSVLLLLSAEEVNWHICTTKIHHVLPGYIDCEWIGLD